jgi:FMN hydrolase / 5-amino-6-(5-phospho-D-ribitylamino)uracil phosphatase
VSGTVELISVDVGGTLGVADGPGLTMRLIAASPLPAQQAREIMRGRLHTRPEITGGVVEEVCAALGIATDLAPFTAPPAPLTLFPGTLQALRELAVVAPVVTLSNVTCVDADTDRLAAQLAPYVAAHFPSCQTGYAKPDANAFHVVAKRYGTDPAQMIHIGDDWTCDVLGAVNAGARAVWISRGRPVPDETVLRRGALVADDLAAAAHLLTQPTLP